MKEPIALDYGRSAGRPTRRLKRAAVGVVVAVAIAAGWRVAAPHVRQHRLVRAQARLLAQAWSADRVAFAVPDTRSPEESRRRRLADEMHVIRLMPNPVFFALRTSAGGSQRIVAVWPDVPVWDGRGLGVRVFPCETYVPITSTPGSRLSGPVRTQAPALHFPRDRDWTVYAGQADPHDAARFTIGYAVGDSRGAIGGTIEGRLQDDGSIAWAKLDGPGDWRP